MSTIGHVGWSLGNYCNARCGHCYSWQVRKSTRTLERDEVRHIVGELASAGVRTVNLGGNEPIYTHGPDPSRSLLPEIVRAATDHGLVVGVTTNGTTAIVLEKQDPDAFARVAEWHVSLDSPFADEHDRNRGGAYFLLARRAMDRIRAHERSLTITTCAMGWNASDRHVAALFALAGDVGADVRINTIKPTDPGHQDLVLRPDQYFRFFREVARHATPTVVGEPTLAAQWGLPARGCPCGTTSLRINGMTPDGRVPVSPCVFLHDLRVGDLLTEPLSALVERPEFAALRTRREATPPACRDRVCDLLEACRGGCAGRAALSGPADPVAAPDNPGVAPELWAALHRPDPYCPVEAAAAGVVDAGPLPCAIEIPNETLRVHAGYLCTVIASPRAAPAWEAEGREVPASPTKSVAHAANTLPDAAWRPNRPGRRGRFPVLEVPPEETKCAS